MNNPADGGEYDLLYFSVALVTLASYHYFFHLFSKGFLGQISILSRNYCWIYLFILIGIVDFSPVLRSKMV